MLYCAVRLRLSWFVVYSVFNFDKVRECHFYIIYIKIVFSNNSFIPLASAEFDDSLLFSGASSIPLYYVLFPANLPHQLFFHPLSLHFVIYFLVCLSILLFPNSYIILFWEFYFLPFSVHVQTNVIGLTLCSVIIVVLKSYDRTIFSMMLSDKLRIICWRCLMNNKIVKLHNESKPILLRAWMQRKQQQ